MDHRFALRTPAAHLTNNPTAMLAPVSPDSPRCPRRPRRGMPRSDPPLIGQSPAASLVCSASLSCAPDRQRLCSSPFLFLPTSGSFTMHRRGEGCSVTRGIRCRSRIDAHYSRGRCRGGDDAPRGVVERTVELSQVTIDSDHATTPDQSSSPSRPHELGVKLQRLDERPGGSLASRAGPTVS